MPNVVVTCRTATNVGRHFRIVDVNTASQTTASVQALEPWKTGPQTQPEFETGVRQWSTRQRRRNIAPNEGDTDTSPRRITFNAK